MNDRNPNPNKLNIYTCDDCGQHIVTKDVDNGTTPFLIGCKGTFGCTGKMCSSFYRVWDPQCKMRWTHEWYAPSIFQTDWNAGVLEHVRKGGLLLRMRLDNPKAREVAQFTHRHIKRGSKYRVIADGKFNIADFQKRYTEIANLDREPVTIYQGEDGEFEVRLKAEFEDGRFEELSHE